ncbi:MAG: hypothetical protein ONB46_10495 [candidate division KSB1 bacterium]|nr:hypothetical protein [candidate division KSB1 bacterium]MDZ7366234.1 hypothetical protein [candidate division KSB1 bacterium]MDZ7404452.1 hypothetical protein [candidate division KSB1 bacterium]
MRKDDEIRLRHMLDAAKEAITLAAGKSRGEIENERLLNLSLVRLKSLARLLIMFLRKFA